MPSPGLTSRPKGELVGEVNRAGRMRTGAGREGQGFLLLPVKRKAALCLMEIVRMTDCPARIDAPRCQFNRWAA